MTLPPPDFYDVMMSVPTNAATQEQRAAYRSATKDRPRGGFSAQEQAQGFADALPHDVRALVRVYPCWN